MLVFRARNRTNRLIDCPVMRQDCLSCPLSINNIPNTSLSVLRIPGMVINMVVKDTHLWHLGTLATARLSDQNQRLVIFQAIQNLIPIVSDGQAVTLRLQIQRLVGVEHKCTNVILGWGRVAFRGKRVVIWKFKNVNIKFCLVFQIFNCISFIIKPIFIKF